MQLHIKYMVSNRCKMLVKAELEKLGIQVIYIELGEAEIEGNLCACLFQKLNDALNASGLELIQDRKSTMVKQIKSSIHEMIFNRSTFEENCITKQLTEILSCNLAHLAHVFSEIEGLTIKQYILSKKIERVKELISQNNLNITEIAYRLNYSSVAHLSAQFKKITGLSPTKYA